MNINKQHLDDILKKATCICNPEQVQAAISSLAETISQDFENRQPLAISIMNGGLMFAGQLLIQMPVNLQCDYIHVSRYGQNTCGGELNWIAKPTSSVSNRDILLIDDILDEGYTLSAVIDYLKSQGANSVRTAVLVDKQHNRKMNPAMTADYVALTLEDQYLVGFGMDYQGYFRNLPGIYAIET